MANLRRPTILQPLLIIRTRERERERERESVYSHLVFHCEFWAGEEGDGLGVFTLGRPNQPMWLSASLSLPYNLNGNNICDNYVHAIILA